MKKKYTVAEIGTMIDCVSSLADPDRQVVHLLTDSRSLTYPDDTLFFALTTKGGDGHRYVKHLYEMGVRSFVVERIPDEISGLPDINLLVVPNALKALQTIATRHRNSCPDVPVVAVTGSSGKTTVKEWLYRILSPDYRIVRSPRSYNSRIGVPLSLWEIEKDTTLAIVEAGISRSGEMHVLVDMIRPEIGILTNIGEEHADGFTSRKAKCAEKLTLFRTCDCIIYCGDDPLVAECVVEACLPAKEIAWSKTDPDSPLFISSIIRHDSDAVTISYSWLRTDGEVTIPFGSDSDIENAIHCLALALYLNRPPRDVVAARMSELTPVGTRLDVLEGVNDCLLVYDSYTSDFSSLAPALDFMGRRLTASHRPAVILSDLMHESLDADSLYPEVARLLEKRGVEMVIGIGPEISAHAADFGVDARFFASTAEFLSKMSPGDFSHEFILIKGAPGFHFEEICDMLEARQHETVLEVNLDAVVHNYNWFRSQLKPTTGIICMVKASGYGAGAYELAKTLQTHGAAYVAVAVCDEGVALRKAGITMPVMVMNPKIANYRTMFTHRLEPEIYSFELLDDILSAARRCGEHHFPIHIKIDSGMHRLGFRLEEIPRLIEILHRESAVEVSSVFSHLSVADCPEEDEYTRMQFEYFDKCCDALQSGFPDHHILRHILNSTGIVRFPEQQHDMVRLGIGLYGIQTVFDGSERELRPVSALYTSVISVREWPAGTTIGYGRRGVLTRPSKIATIPVGYADGIDRHLGNGNMKVWLHGQRCPTVGTICMDACMIDVTGIECRPGDRVEIFGPHVAASELADTLGTIPYEILTSVSDRTKRIYYRE
ncbi:MAG: bifunctional UDP-N-acetylmuramoyl-tripeptide:D-alanyl-D-alanine ligase/alanine racemase [Bacteroides sp.]|nr:bifunctional UDP-N-acetylmuramoyl-tripeptide:D-alanyl-D-alanine ligase/alanine racemase [Bacteroides sp.]